jgi:hypothetical protein
MVEAVSIIHSMVAIFQSIQEQFENLTNLRLHYSQGCGKVAFATSATFRNFLAQLFETFDHFA